MDFTVRQYQKLLHSLIKQDYHFQTFENFLRNPHKKTIILRHDVDLYPKNSLVFAKIQAEHNIKGVYYFRAVPESWDESIITNIASLGHEIGYHYENLTTCDGNLGQGIKDFKENLEKLRKLTPVSTICMHGSPMSKYDSKDLWKKYHYQDFGIIGEPYFDINFDKVFYLTDTGRKWDGENVSVRDKVVSAFKHTFHTSNDIIAAAKTGALPNQIMFTFHPQRWNNSLLLWTKELLLQSVKNTVKKLFFVRK